jgi:hypothetical protein
MKTPGTIGACCMVLLALSCNLFQTRDPENPVQSSANFSPPTDVNIVLENMSNAFQDLSSFNYVQSFSDTALSGRTFSFKTSTQAASQYSGLFSEWSRQSEQQYFDNFKTQLQSNAVPTLVLNITSESITADSALVEGTYQLTIPHTKPAIEQSASGRLQFFLIKDSREYWVISRWVDLANQTGDFTWSHFKGVFGQ